MDKKQSPLWKRSGLLLWVKRMMSPTGKVPVLIAKQCGTSTEMIQRHYDHLTTLIRVKALVGSEGAELTKLIKAYQALE